MITISGKILNTVHSQNVNRSTGEMRDTYTAEILHTVRGRSEIEYLKLDPKVFAHWTKQIGAEISAEVRFYAMKSDDGSVNSGLILSDKTSLPTIIKPVQPVQAAAPVIQPAPRVAVPG